MVKEWEISTPVYSSSTATGPQSPVFPALSSTELFCTRLAGGSPTTLGCSPQLSEQGPKSFATAFSAGSPGVLHPEYGQILRGVGRHAGGCWE